ncbi:hypothetical protein [Streptococcus salivarius]|uniref:hypothetical protein n=1 Tax=Streptococcus salivarius TaxID=1304 RepID=UPI00093E007A|nr:hypothetical protein [Streptococcus salivarius]
MAFSGQKQLDDTPIQERVTILYEYLVLGRSMDQIALDYYGDKNWIISAVCQGYSEKGGKNRGKVNATKEDVLRFIQAYPYGTSDIGLTLGEFLQNRSFSNARNFGSESYKTHSSNDSFSSHKESSLIGLGCSVAVLIVLAMTGLILKWWIISLIIVFVAIGCFTDLNDGL